MALRALQGPTGGGAPVGGTGITNTIPRWTGPSTLGDSVITQNSTALVTTGSSSATQTTFRVRTVGTANNAPVFSLYREGVNEQVIWAGSSTIRFGFATDPAGYTDAQLLTATKMGIDASGNVGIGTATPNSTAGIGLTIYQAAAGSLYLQNATDIARIFQQPTNLYIDSSVGSASGSIIFRRGSTVTESARIDSAGRLLVGTTGTPSSGAVRVVVAANSGGQQWHSQGLGGCAVVASANTAQWYVYPGANVGSEGYLSSVKLTETGLDVTTASATPGIKLPATPGNTDPNTLDAYVDGGTAAAGGASFTATLKGSTTDPTTPVTTTGKYVLVGKVLTMSIYFDNVNTTGASGDVIIETNLAAALRPQMRSVGQVGIYNFNAVGLGTFADARTDGKIYIMCNQNNNVWTAATHSAGAGRYLLVTVTFIIG